MSLPQKLLRLFEEELIAILAIAIILGSLIGYSLAATSKVTLTEKSSTILRASSTDDSSN